MIVRRRRVVTKVVTMSSSVAMVTPWSWCQRRSGDWRRTRPGVVMDRTVLMTGAETASSLTDKDTDVSTTTVRVLATLTCAVTASLEVKQFSLIEFLSNALTFSFFSRRIQQHNTK